jgi:hypothetical protein
VNFVKRSVLVITRLLGLTLVLAVCVSPVSGGAPHRLALLIGSPWSGEENVIQNDIASFRKALAKRGFEPSQIKEVSGKLARAQVLDAIRATSAEVATWDAGEVFLYYTGHGWFSGDSAKTARPALALDSASDPTRALYWDEVFLALHLPQHVQLILLPDC